MKPLIPISFLLIFSLFFVCVFHPNRSFAQEAINRSKKSNSVQKSSSKKGKLIKSGQEKEKYAAGFSIGVPTGLNFSMNLDDKTKLYTMLAYDLVKSRIQIGADWRAIYFPRFKDLIDPFIGIGGSFLLSNNHANAGIRIPIGIEYVFPMHPLTAFLEIVPTMMILPSTFFEFQMALGIQFRF